MLYALRYFGERKKKILTGLSLIGLMAFLTACSNQPITSSSTGFWDRYIVYNFSLLIVWLSKVFGGNYGVGIIIFTFLINVIIAPLRIWQSKMMNKQLELQPEIDALKKKYPGTDTASRQAIQEETQKIYSAHNVNPMAGCLPVLVQLPFMFALAQAIYRSPSLQQGTLLWMNLSKPDPFFVLPLLAAIFTFISSWLSFYSQPTMNGSNKVMLIVMPVFIFISAMGLASAISVYWVASNLFMVLQTLLFQNPFKIRKARQEKELKKKRLERELEKAKRGQGKYRHGKKKK
ncbi:membrane protein insertase YidC [Xylocopilactobacillus apicola]|uniref:Membrane protein insertase YidC n=1 Tax=Xylocopilactobacillus apicola TaxID=2932184 RepID=A0AAU9DU55_9LACO|nr:membrane protein insertase YidC [Xylocopilactobacillus apicola]BDR59734.1 membrane protein insertase YidC 2 [Xylocopilactobacillus apicola]